MISNLPPGVNVNDIPGNRPEDAAFEAWMNASLALVQDMGLSDEPDDEDRFVEWLTEVYDKRVGEYGVPPLPQVAAESVRDRFNEKPEVEK